MIEGSLQHNQKFFREIEDTLLDLMQSASSPDAIRGLSIDRERLQAQLAEAIFSLHLLGRAQVWADVQERDQRPENAGFAALVFDPQETLEPLPFEEAISFFRSKLNLSPGDFASLEAIAKSRAFSIAAGASEEITKTIRSYLDQALNEGLSLDDFKQKAAQVLENAGLAARNPWYWDLVYQQNLQSSYQVGRWKQLTHP
ncbi:MAG: hypothetical protein AB7P69_03675, partial [Candidatus Binatia bacterium]